MSFGFFLQCCWVEVLPAKHLNCPGCIASHAGGSKFHRGRDKIRGHGRVSYWNFWRAASRNLKENWRQMQEIRPKFGRNPEWFIGEMARDMPEIYRRKLYLFRLFLPGGFPRISSEIRQKFLGVPLASVWDDYSFIYMGILRSGRQKKKTPVKRSVREQRKIFWDHTHTSLVRDIIFDFIFALPCIRCEEEWPTHPPLFYF